MSELRQFDDTELLTEDAEARRLADALDLLDGGRDVDIDPREDPELSALLETAMVVRDAAEHSTAATAFNSYRQRSRAYVLHTLERPVRVVVNRRPPWYQRWSFGAPIAAAAAAVLALVAFLGPISLFEGDSAGGNLTAKAVDQELARVQLTLNAITTSTEAGEAVESGLLRTLTDGTVTLAQQVANYPESVRKEAVVTYLQTTYLAQGVLQRTATDPTSRDALQAAREATDDAFNVAADYMVANLQAQVAARDGSFLP